MKFKLLIIFILSSLLGCDMPTELSISDSAKPADKFARNFLDKVITGQLESAFSDIEPEILNDQGKEFVSNTYRNINGAKVKGHKLVEQTWTTGISSNTGQYTTYRLAYEYEFEKGNILFITTIKEKDGHFSVIAFNGDFLTAPLDVQTKFTLADKSILHYCFLVFSILVPLFILLTFVVMLLSKMTIKKKIIWALIILFISLPKFVINWSTGGVDFNLFNVSLLGSSFGRTTLYTAWLLSFSIPVGSILFWFKRKSLVLKQVLSNKNDLIANDSALPDL